MNRVGNIERYLRAKLASEQMPATLDDDAAPAPFVTISRQAGIGGHRLGEVILDTFNRQPDTDVFGGWQIYDKTVCEIVARDPAFSGSLDSLMAEEYRSPTTDFFHQMLRSTVDQKMVMNRAFLVVRTIAGMGNAIIVGRGGAQVTRDMPTGVSLRVVAPDAVRIQRAMDTMELPERDAAVYVKKRDADRARLIRAHFDVDIDDPAGYDLVANAGRMSFDVIAAITATLVRERAAAPAEHEWGGVRNASS